MAKTKSRALLVRRNVGESECCRLEWRRVGAARVVRRANDLKIERRVVLNDAAHSTVVVPSK